MKKRNPRPRNRKPAGITKEQAAFAKEYVSNGCNGSQAVFDACPRTRKWTSQSRAVKASKLLAIANVQLRIQELTELAKQAANAEFVMSQEEIMARLTMLGRANLAHYMKIDEDTGAPTISFKDTTEAQFYALNEASVEDVQTPRGKGTRTKIKLADRISAMKLIGTKHGMFVVTAEMVGKGGGPVQVVMSSAEAAV